jgi:uncharacterized protein (UPF0332 family)
MSVAPKDLLSQAKRLYAQASNEADYRNVVSRAYYAAYHEAIRFHQSLPTQGKSPSKKVGVHAALIAQLFYPTIPQTDELYLTSRNVSRHLSWLQDKRVKADYQLDVDFEGASCGEVIRRTERLFELCARL